MKKKIAAVVVLAVLICAFSCGSALSEATDTMITEVSVTFVEAIYFYDFPEGGGMDIDFGEQRLPAGVLDLPTSTDSTDNSHTLRVCDRRAEAGGWSVSAISTLFTSGSESFTAYTQLHNPTLSDGLTPNLIGTSPNEFIRIADTVRKIIDAETGLAQGNYDLTCTARNIRLRFITTAESAKVKPLSYTATITWTLTLEPEP